MNNNTQEEIQSSPSQVTPPLRLDAPGQKSKSKDSWQWLIVVAVVILFTIVMIWAFFFKDASSGKTHKSTVEPVQLMEDDSDDYDDDEIEWLKVISGDSESLVIEDLDSNDSSQSSKNDTIRRNDMLRVDTSLAQYQFNHATQPDNLPNPGTTAVKWEAPLDNTFGSNCSTNIACAFVRDYMNSGSSENDGKPNNFEDPNGVPYNVVITPNWASGENAAGASIQIASGAGSKLEKVADGYTIRDNGGNAFDAYTIYIIPGADCIGNSAIASTERHYAIMYHLEEAGVYCIDDQ